MQTRHAVALRAITHADESFAKDETILSMDAGRFADWSAPGVDLVRAATDAEVAKARGDKPAAPARKPAPKRTKPAKAAAPAPDAPNPTPPAGDA